jgi:peroxiredoxin
MIFALGLILTLASAQVDPAPESKAAEEEPQIYTTLEGQVVDPIGGGISDAEIVITHLEDPKFKELAITDEYGDFKITLPGARTGVFLFTFNKAGFQSQTLENEVFEDDLEPFVDVMLDGALAVNGLVREIAELLPLPGATVSLETPYRRFSVETDAEGRFEFTGLMPSAVQLIVDATGFGRYLESADIRSLVSGEGSGLNGEALFVVTMAPEKILKLTVVNHMDEGIANASVEVATQKDYRTVTTDEKGTVTLRGLPAETAHARIRVTHRDYVSSGDFDTEVAFTESTYLKEERIRLARGCTVTGKIIDRETRRPMNGARIMFGSEISDSAPYTFSSVSGEYTLSALPPGPGAITVHVNNRAPGLREITLSPDVVAKADFRLEVGRVITGTVSDKEDQPVKHAELVAMKWRNHATLALFAESDDQGRFALDNAPADAFLLDITASGRGAAYDLEIKPDQDDYAFKIEAQAESENGGLSVCGARIGDAYPGTTLTSLDGHKYDTDAMSGKWIVLDFWATWCGPCVQDMPAVKKLHATFAQRDDVQILGISRDFDGNALSNFVKTNKLEWPQIFGPDSGSDALAKAFDVRGIPCMILIDPTGKVAGVDMRPEQLMSELDRRLNAN